MRNKTKLQPNLVEVELWLSLAILTIEQREWKFKTNIFGYKVVNLMKLTFPKCGLLKGFMSILMVLVDLAKC